MVDAAAQVHVFSVRVYYEDTDAGGVVYYANYLKFAERGRSELLRQHGIDNTGLQQRHGINFAVRDCSVTYHAPARLDESLSVLTDVQSIGAATLSIDDVNSDDAYDSLDDQSVLVRTADDETAGFSVSDFGGYTLVTESGTTGTFGGSGPPPSRIFRHGTPRHSW